MDRIRQCPCCPIRFQHRTELEWHLREEHPQMHFEYVTRSQRAQLAAVAVPGARRPADATGPAAPVGAPTAPGSDTAV